MAAGLFGYFRFSIVGAILTGGYLNKHTTSFQPETGTLTIPGIYIFEGTYDTNWSDPDSKSATLVISKVGNIYSLSWNVLTPAERFEGKGILESTCELAGFYERI